MKRRWGCCWRSAAWIAMLLTGLALADAPVARNNGSVELHVKAAYLFNFGRYVSWPQEGGDVVIGVLGPDPIVDVIEKTVTGKTINGRTYRVKVFVSAEQMERCDILFLPHSTGNHTHSILTALSGKPILTVSDVENFASWGGMIEFLLIDDTLKFDINLEAAGRAGLRISSELLRVAHDVKGRRR